MRLNEVFPAVYLDIEISNKQIGRIVVELFEVTAPRACKDFRQLGSLLKGTYFHRVIKNFMIQGGDINHARADQYGDNMESAARCVEGSTLEIENSLEDMSRPFLLCTVDSNSGPDSTQFFITTAPTPHLRGKHTVFGQVKYGKSVVREVERVATTSKSVPIEAELPVIVEFGDWSEGDPVPIWNACYDQIAGDIYEEYPEDDENIDRNSSGSVFEAASTIKESGTTLLKGGDAKNAILKFKKCLRYVMEYIPDEDQEPEFFTKFTDLKRKIYLNLSLSYLKVSQYTLCAEYCNLLLEMNLSDLEKAKTLFRLAQTMMHGRKYDEAIVVLEKALGIAKDPAIEKELARAEELLKKKRSAEKATYARFFN